ncbi:MAG: hypothetical protein IPN63_11950 [Gammaproteobacteria bacterium]|nr:hypothetical protein [Gammaproteobacteria bacterium]
MPMDAARRDLYLTALGVVRYRPRPAHGDAAAVCAEVSQQQFATDPASMVPSSAAVPPVPAALSPVTEVERSESPLAALREQTRTPVAVTRAVPEIPPEPAIVPVGAPAALAFRIACWQPAPDLLVFDALPAGGWPDRERMALLSNMLRAIGRLPGPLAAAEVIDWPPFAGADASLAGARESLALFVAGRMATAPFRWLLALGEISWHCLGADSGHTVGTELALAGDARAILLPGLADMLAVPARKAETWRAIRQLAPAAN